MSYSIQDKGERERERKGEEIGDLCPLRRPSKHVLTAEGEGLREGGHYSGDGCCRNPKLSVSHSLRYRVLNPKSLGGNSDADNLLYSIHGRPAYSSVATQTSPPIVEKFISREITCISFFLSSVYRTWTEESDLLNRTHALSFCGGDLLLSYI